ncbi:hypothetical protein [Pseudorhodoplanes sp.]|uniref:hypothetical protein n=1 Tax=Pseudorhodoplanes sp. TaxID=1934341 RepID=UPI003D14A001
MCQQWFSVVGLASDIVGVILIVYEWHIMFWRHYHRRLDDIDAHYEKLRRKADGEAEPVEEDNWSMGKHMWMGLREDIVYRAKLAYVGVALLLFGFVLQLIGALPSDITGLKSCG